VEERLRYEVAVLQELTWYYVIDNPVLGIAQEGQKRLLRDLFDVLVSWLAGESSRARWPQRLRDALTLVQEDPATKSAVPESAALDDFTRARAVCDFLSALTEDQIIDLYERLTGTSRASMFGAWFQ
jgi:dGTPase